MDALHDRADDGRLPRADDPPGPADPVSYAVHPKRGPARRRLRLPLRVVVLGVIAGGAALAVVELLL